MKNKTLVNRLLCLIGVTLCCYVSSLFLFEKHEIIYCILSLCSLIILFIIGTMIYYLQKKSTPILINLTNISNEILQIVLIAIAILLSVYLIPIDYFIFSVILIITSILLSVFFQKMLVINSKGIRNVFKWNLKWDDIETYSLDKDNGTLNVQLRDGTNQQIKGIKSKYYPIILENISYYMKK
ncbi:hypothetical protein FACS189451_09020 [Bacteroidia bacterium]|nr:hypothetical protein FACS189451_09020 [Bacteroidia bacterium]GHU79623.1 hypothetical protein FACS1894145_4160 [Bacteroidia bacterium]